MTQASIDFWDKISDRFSLAVGVMSAMAGLYRYKKINFPSKMVLYATVTGILINELFNISQEKSPNNPVLLHISYFNSFVYLALFYNYCIPLFTKMKIGIYVGLSGFLFWAFYSFFFQPMAYTPTNHSYPYFVAFRGILWIILSLAGLYFLLRDNTWSDVRSNAVFWFILMDLFGTGLEFIYDTAIGMVKSNSAFFITSLFLYSIPNSLGAIFTTIIFLRFPKKQLSQGNSNHDNPDLSV